LDSSQPALDLAVLSERAGVLTFANTPVIAAIVRVHLPAMQANLPFSSPNLALAGAMSRATEATNFPHATPLRHAPGVLVRDSITGSPPTRPEVVAVVPGVVGTRAAENSKVSAYVPVGWAGANIARAL